MRVLALRLLAAMRPGETPVSIPNTTVKPRTADGTARERGRAGGCQNQKKTKTSRKRAALTAIQVRRGFGLE